MQRPALAIAAETGLAAHETEPRTARNPRRAPLMTTLPATASFAGTLRDLVSLIKPRITFLVITTSAGGLWLAPGTPGLTRSIIAVLAIAAVVMSANALNCWMERVSDRAMTRTMNRPLPAGRLDPKIALVFGLALGAISVPVLALLVNPITGELGAIALIMYVWMYTPLKQKTWTALLVGAVPGAMPPLMGWTAATGHVELPGVVLFAVLFIWQIPHFIAISVFRQSEYERAAIRVLPSVVGTWCCGARRSCRCRCCSRRSAWRGTSISSAQRFSAPCSLPRASQDCAPRALRRAGRAASSASRSYT